MRLRSRYWAWKMRRRRRKIVANLHEPYRSIIKQQDAISRGFERLGKMRKP